MKLKDINKCLKARESILKDFQELESLLQRDTKLRKEITDKLKLDPADFDVVLSEVRSAYYCTKIANVKKALDELDVDIPLDM